MDVLLRAGNRSHYLGCCFSVKTARCLIALVFVNWSFCARAADNIPQCFVADYLIKSTTIVDGTGAKAEYNHDIAISDGNILLSWENCVNAKIEIDGRGLIAVPGFINTLSWGAEALFFDGRAQSDIFQGITLEVFGEGWSLGPLSLQMAIDEFGKNSRYGVSWRSFGEGMNALESKGVAINFASYVGGSTLRKYVMIDPSQQATTGEIAQMVDLAEISMDQGALGIGISLEGFPGKYADTQELLALAQMTKKHDGIIAAHLRNEAGAVMTALDEFLTIVRKSGVRSEIYHLKVVNGSAHSYDILINAIERARSEGLQVFANAYPYSYLSTSASHFFSYDKGGRFSDVASDNIFFPQYSNSLKKISKLSLSEAIKLTGKSSTQLFKLAADDAQKLPLLVRFTKEGNIRSLLTLPWVSIGTDATTAAINGAYASRVQHPRASGSFTRFLASVTKGELKLNIEKAIHKITGAVADKLNLCKRGKILHKYVADLVLLDLKKLEDTSSYDKPLSLSKGVQYLFVNGVPVVFDSLYTGKLPGLFVSRCKNIQ